MLKKQVENVSYFGISYLEKSFSRRIWRMPRKCPNPRREWLWLGWLRSKWPDHSELFSAPLWPFPGWRHLAARQDPVWCTGPRTRRQPSWKWQRENCITRRCPKTDQDKKKVMCLDVNWMELQVLSRHLWMISSKSISDVKLSAML